MGTALSGALALSFLAMPAAQADGGERDGDRRVRVTPLKADQGMSARGVNDVQIPSVTINGGKDVIVGTTKEITFTATAVIINPEGVDDAYMDLWHGDTVDTLDGYIPPNEDAATCETLDSVDGVPRSVCKLTLTAIPGTDLYKNTLAGRWNVTVAVHPTGAPEDEWYGTDYYDTHSVKRASRIAINASPEPVAKGKTITAVGTLTRANWETFNYRGYLNQTVKLQFRLVGTGKDRYSNVKAITSNTSGLRATTTAVNDGYWRFGYAGSSTTQPAFATPDYVDVR